MPAAAFAARVMKEVTDGEVPLANTRLQEQSEDKNAQGAKEQKKALVTENKKIEDEKVPLASGKISSGGFKMIPVLCIIVLAILLVVYMSNRMRRR